MKTNWTKPDASSLSAYQRGYIDLVPAGDLTEILEKNLQNTLLLVSSLGSEKLRFRYAPGKWSIPQILVHMIDTERIFSYRVLRISRGDQTPLPGYEENDYAAASRADERDFKDILEEYSSVRKATLSLFKSLSAEDLLRKGTSNGKEISAGALCYMLAGHEIHHCKVIKDKYLS